MTFTDVGGCAPRDPVVGVGLAACVRSRCDANQYVSQVARRTDGRTAARQGR